ncbi:MAG: hypothetical protein JNN20_14910 [Betaproteobacteria bacterium]|nr:hypothetical protein [Betaproteobacteria bacterium]
MLPQYWIDFLDSNGLRGKYCDIGEDLDESGAGAYLSIFNEAQSLDEATNFWPGIAVFPDGYIPVASCQIGSGDPYFINVGEGPNGCLYRIRHDAVNVDGYKAEDAIEVILRNYELLIGHIKS